MYFVIEILFKSILYNSVQEPLKAFRSLSKVLSV